jgi:hypothetical protein
MTMLSKDSRKNLRHKLTDTFVVIREGVCQVINLSSGGFSFGCVNERELPEKWTVDIVNNKGVHIWDLPVRTVWAEKNCQLEKSSIYAVKVGVKFENGLSLEHQSALNELV